MGQRRGVYAPEFRQQMVELVKAGRKPSELAKEFGCHDTSITAWVRQANDAAPFAAGSALKRMLAGNVSDIHLVRCYLDGVRGGGWS